MDRERSSLVWKSFFAHTIQFTGVFDMFETSIYKDPVIQEFDFRNSSYKDLYDYRIDQRLIVNAKLPPI